MSETIAQFTGTHEFLSNFHREADGKTAEHRFQAAKTTDPTEQARVLASATPAAAKRAGRRVTLRADWNNTRVRAMDQVLRTKFADPELAARLLATGDATLVEGNTWHDNFWGRCTCARCAKRTTPGLNHLGRALMRVREELARG